MYHLHTLRHISYVYLYISLRDKVTLRLLKLYFLYIGCGPVVQGAGHKANRLVMQCINGVSSNPVEGRTNICQLKDLILTLFRLIYQTYIYIYVFLKFDVNKLPETFPLSLKLLNIYINSFFTLLTILQFSNKTRFQNSKSIQTVIQSLFRRKLAHFEISNKPFHHIVRWFLVTNTVQVLLFVDTNFRDFYKNVLIRRFLNSWFQTLQATING